MIGVITGDVIRSRKANPDVWLKKLKEQLRPFGKTPFFWEIYGGDTFQLRLEDPLMVLMAAIKIKAGLRTVKSVDVRMSIGIGDINYEAKKITESNGTAFIHSGEKFELLKKEKQNLALKTPWAGFDTEMNLYLKLALFVMDKWTVNGAEMVGISIANPTMSQEKLGKILGIKQNAVSNRLKRTGFDTIVELNSLYQIKLKELL